MSLTRKEFLATPLVFAAPQARRKPRNVLFLLSDQHRQQALGVRGDPHARTPNLDGLARDGVRFDNAYCAYPVCTPSRASLLTGTWNHNNGVVNNTTPWPWQIKTMAHHFGRQGYATGLIGKMHFVDAQTHGFDYRLDFNDWYQYLGPKTKLYADELSRANSGSGMPQIDDLWRDFGDPWKGLRTLDNRKGAVLVGQASKIAEQDHFESFVARETVRFLKNFGTKHPFFLISSYLKPHDPFMPPERFAAQFRASDVKLPSTFGRLRPGQPDTKAAPKVIQDLAASHPPTPELADENAARQRIAMYYANLAYLDDVLGGVIKGLAELGLADDTLVVYSSDHGEMLGEHGLWQKSLFYEPSGSVPLIFRGPGIAQPGSVCKTPVSQVGLAATLLDACGLPATGFDEPSFLPLLADTNAKWTRPAFAEYALKTKQARYMIRKGDWKFNHWINDLPELYNLRDDPGESRNLAADPKHKATAESLKAELLRWHQPEAVA